MIDEQEPAALSKREHEVFLTMCDGLDASEIAEELGVTNGKIGSRATANPRRLDRFFMWSTFP